MGCDDVKIKKSFSNKIQDFLNSVISIFIKKQKALPESSKQTNAEFEKVENIYNELTNNDSFDNLRKTYEYYNIGTNSSGKTVAIEKTTGYVVEDPKFVARVRFISIWRKSAIGNKDTKDEKASKEECFNLESEEIYNEINECIQEQLRKTGNINTLEVLNKLKTSEYKWARSTSRRLFRNEIQAEIVTEYFRSLNFKFGTIKDLAFDFKSNFKTETKIKKQTQKTLTTSQALYGVDEEI